MKLFSTIILLFFSLNAFAQKPDEVLATANGQSYTAQDLAPETRQAFENLPKNLRDARQALLEQQIVEMLFDREAAAQKTTVEKIFAREVRAKVAAPTEREIRAIYDANRAAIGARTLEDVREQIVEYLRRDAQAKIYGEYVSNLKAKYKVALGKDVNAANVSRFEILATVGDKQISLENFETKNKVRLAELEADARDAVRQSLEQTVYSNLLAAEAKAQNLETSDFIAREITDKLKDFSETERARLESALRQKLFAKYNAKFFVKESAPIVQTVATDNQPTRGAASAPVTVVMFTDFQCPACSATHPVLQAVLKSYGDKIRFVVRDFPLFQIHENAYRAALAANAAAAQNKFFEYTEILYQNQAKLDDASLVSYAAQSGFLDAKRFEADLKSEKYAPDVERDIADGRALGIGGTPTVYVNGFKVRELSEEGFRAAIERALKK